MTTARETEYVAWPAWATGPNGEREIFNSEAEVPGGWSHHDGVKSKSKAPAPASATAPVVEAGQNPSAAGEKPKPEVAAANATEGGETDAAGVAWNPELHAATKTKTNAGLWRMKVGVRRPEGQDKILPLDL